MNTTNMHMKFEIEIPKQLPSRNHAAYQVQKPKNPIWPPENDVAENQ